jgi:hypothetical protein
MKADEFISIEGTVSDAFPTGRYRPSECIFDMKAFSNINDAVYELITMLPEPRLAPARALLRRIEERDLYVCLGKSSFKRGDHVYDKSDDEIAEEIVAVAFDIRTGRFDENVDGDGNWDGGDQDTFDHDRAMGPASAGGGKIVRASTLSGSGTAEGEEEAAVVTATSSSSASSSSSSLSSFSQQLDEDIEITAEDLIVEKMHIHYGMHDQNPVSRMRFYQKNGGPDAIGREVEEWHYAAQLPRVYEEKAVRLFCRTKGKEAVARQAFTAWCRRQAAPSPFPSLSQQSNSQESAGMEEEPASPHWSRAY